jgi:ribosome-binding factor A
MAREFSRTQRVADYLQRELAVLIQQELRDPRIGMVSITGVDVSRDLAHARVYFTRLESDTESEAREATEVLNRSAGFLRSQLSRDSSMRSVPRLQFRFDESVGHGRAMEALISEARSRDGELDSDDSADADDGPAGKDA